MTTFKDKKGAQFAVIYAQLYAIWLAQSFRRAWIDLDEQTAIYAGKYIIIY